MLQKFFGSIQFYCNGITSYKSITDIFLGVDNQQKTVQLRNIYELKHYIFSQTYDLSSREKEKKRLDRI